MNWTAYKSPDSEPGAEVWSVKAPDGELIFFGLDEERANLFAAAPDQLAAGAEVDRLSLVIESAVRNADPANLRAVVAALRANRKAAAKATGKALVTPPLSDGDG